MPIGPILLVLAVIQRLLELRRSSLNRQQMAERGYVSREPAGALAVMIALHLGFFAGCIFEPFFFPVALPPALVYAGAALFLCGQALRLWALRTLGTDWNIAVMAPEKGTPAAGTFAASGPYRYIRHPNYLAVILEFVGLPLACSAPVTAAACSVMNARVLARRIRLEESYLHLRPGYPEYAATHPRFIPRLFGR